eukprot:146928-Heterocapsa_arctica.AAC.1
MPDHQKSDIACQGSEGRQQETLITCGQRPVLCNLLCHPRPSSHDFRAHRHAPTDRLTWR